MGCTVSARVPMAEYPPGARAPISGVYELRNVLGSPTGVRTTIACGDPLPAAPRGFTWQLLETHMDDHAPD
ncbi:MAG TPA: hypothetical protein VL614_16525 [Acetobacteraceae bacterium]|jgi:hypothetical protein|nr:hypothetical protein [Acetobacteraceae bacterium]